MMKRFMIGVSGLMLLTACSGNPEAKLNETCTNVMADPDVQRDIRNADISVDVYCACAAKQLLAMPEAAGSRAINSLETMEKLMAEHDGSAEKAFEVLSEAGRADDATPEARAAYESMDDLGDQLEDILDAMEEAGGTCPA